ncbi:uncharacterized protein LOC144878079 [Branchiostoma floridae x Branchiostoma japonicum]
MWVLVFYMVFAAALLRSSLCYLTEEEILQRVETNANSQPVNNTRLMQHLIQRYQLSHRLQCSQFCFLTKGCQSYNYYDEEGICELNDQTYLQDVSFQTGQDPGWEYHGRYSFYMIRALWYECSAHNPCQNGAVCTRKVLKSSGVERPPCAPLCVCPVGYSGEHCSIQDCQEGSGASYRGKVPVTTSGKVCQRWSSQTPHVHSRTPDSYPSAGLEQNNYCRNPAGWSAVWCYTADPDERWEQCDVPVCG